MRGSALRITPTSADHPYTIAVTLGQLTSTITGPEFVCSAFSRHRPASLAFAVIALTAAAAPFADSNGLDPRLLRWSERL
jgi:hypothetical protein